MVRCNGSLGSRITQKRVHQKDELETRLAKKNDNAQEEETERRRCEEAEHICELHQTAHHDE